MMPNNVCCNLCGMSEREPHHSKCPVMKTIRDSIGESAELSQLRTALAEAVEVMGIGLGEERDNCATRYEEMGLWQLGWCAGIQDNPYCYDEFANPIKESFRQTIAKCKEVLK